MNVLIIEDEGAAALALTRLLYMQRPEAEVLAVLDSVSIAEAWLLDQPPPLDLIFMDIHLADGNSFELLRRVPITSPIIFTTAYDQHALEAFQVNGIDYLLKPLLAANLRRALDKFDTLQRHYTEGAAPTTPVPDLTHLLQAMQRFAGPVYKTSWLLHHKGKMVPVAVEDVAYFTIRNSLVFLSTVTKLEYEVEQTLDELEAAVDPRRFFRANRQTLIARRSIIELEPHFNGRLLVKLTPPAREEVIISKARAVELKVWLNAG